MVKEIKALQQQEHALQEESLSVRLRIEQIDTTISEHNSKIKHWQKEVSGDGCIFIQNLENSCMLSLICEGVQSSLSTKDYKDLETD